MLLLPDMSSLAVRGESNLASENVVHVIEGSEYDIAP
jgi:hypothetical protein